MSRTQLLESFRESLVTATLDNIRRIPEIVGEESVFAVAVYSTEDLDQFTSAFSTEETFEKRRAKSGFDASTLAMLKDHPDLLAEVDLDSDDSNYLRITADEWAYIGNGDDAFAVVNAITQQLYQLTEEDWGETRIQLLEEISNALGEVRSQGPFSHSSYSSDVLLTFQWSDIETHEPELLNIAKPLNTPHWQAILQQEWGGTKQY